MDSALVGEAATFVENTSLLSQIVDWADNFTASAEDLALFESTLEDQFGVKAEAGIAYDGPFPNVVQGEGESLDAYHGRVLSASLTLFEVTGVNKWVHRFVLDLLDKLLLAESISQGALSSDSLRSALQIVKKANSLLEVKAQMARGMAQQARLGLIDGVVQAAAWPLSERRVDPCLRTPDYHARFLGRNSTAGYVSGHSDGAVTAVYGGAGNGGRRLV
ncbi:hypothetical protein E4U58_005899 [Claviceps cyperi]|nr:hypothetical protein E4U58_005899 [Claviceps cyperi]